MQYTLLVTPLQTTEADYNIAQSSFSDVHGLELQDIISSLEVLMTQLMNYAICPTMLFFTYKRHQPYYISSIAFITPPPRHFYSNEYSSS